MQSYKIILLMLFVLLIGNYKNYIHANDEKQQVFTEEDSSFSLLADVKVADNFVRLKHLTDKEISNMGYRELLICKRPLKDKPLTLTKSYLKALFKTNGMDEKTMYLMDIPEEVKISYMSPSNVSAPNLPIASTNSNSEVVKSEPLTEIDISEILLRVSNAIDTQLRKSDPQVSIYMPQSRSYWKLKVPEDYDLKILPGLMIKSNSVTAKIGVYYKEALVDAKVFNFKADIYIKSLAANGNFDKGHEVKKGDFTMQLVPYSIDANNYISDEKSLVGLVLKKNIKVGDGLEDSDVESPVIVQRGASVNIIVKDEGYSIRANGIAQEAGRIGDQVVVLMKNNDVKIKCTVTGENAVSIIK